jgi:hypothetical protein
MLYLSVVTVSSRPLAALAARGTAGLECGKPLCHTLLMRQVGRSIVALPAALPCAAALRAAAIHQATGVALAAVPTTGVVKGIYRFATHADMNRHCEEALTLALAMNIERRASGVE